MRFFSWKKATVAVALAAVATLGSAPPGAAKDPLVVKGFLLGRLEDNTYKFIATGARGTQNAYRNNVLLFVFSAPVDFDTLDARTVKIGIPAGTGLFIDAEGSFYRYVVYERDESAPAGDVYIPKRVYRNRVIFDPTSRQEEELKQNPYGFEVNSLYTVTVPGLDTGTTKVVRSTEGAYNERTFTTTFRTTDKYLQDYDQPHIVKVEANDAPNVPLDGRSSVDSRADIIAFFTEPMLVSSFDVNSTFRVFNSGQNRYMSGTIRAAPDGRSFTFRPAFGYGRGPFNIRVTLASTLTDRPGNPLDKGLTVNFTTEYDPFAPNYDEITEDFVNGTFEDKTYTATYDKSTWNATQTPGTLSGVFGAKSLDITFGQTGGYASPFWIQPCHTQNLYSPAQMGSTARTVSQWVWRHYLANGRATTSTYSTVLCLLGHNAAGSLNTNFTGSFSDTPVQVFSGSYTPPSADVEWITGPTFTTTWAYNGRDHVVVDTDSRVGGSSPNYWRYTRTGQGGGNTMYDTLNGTTVLTWNHDIRFLYLVDKSEAQSLWYDTTQTNPLWLDPIVLSTVPPGTVSSIVFQGGHESPTTANTVDTSTITAWTSDPFSDLPGFRFIRFHVDMTSNLGSSTRPSIDQVKLPYIFY